MRNTQLGILLFSFVFITCTPAMAKDASFACTKAQGEVEKLICSDNTLKDLDKKLTQVYKSASNKAKGSMLKTLRAEQRGWIKGRNECWKANGNKTWITASWTVDSVKACVEAQYQVRTSELQAVWRLVPPNTVMYTCQNNPANEVIANFFATEPATIRLERGDRTATLWQVGAVNGAQFEGQNVSVTREAKHLKVNWLNVNDGITETLTCAEK